jgi:hypothetical protein
MRSRKKVQGLRGSSRVRAGLIGVVIAAMAVAGILVALVVTPPVAGAQTVPLTTTVATTTEPAPDPTPQPDPSPDPGPSPSPSPSPEPTTSTKTAGDKQHEARTPAKHRDRHRKQKRHAPAAPRFERAHEPRDVPVYAEGSAAASVQLLASLRSPGGGSNYIRTLLLAVLGMAVALLALAAMPTRALAGVSGELVARRSQVALVGVSIMSGVAVGAFIVLLGT